MDYLQNDSAMEVMEMAHTKMGQNCYLLHECQGWGTLGFCWVLFRELCPLWTQAESHITAPGLGVMEDLLSPGSCYPPWSDGEP